MKFTIPGRPVTKKNHQRIAYNAKTHRAFIRQSKQYEAYEALCGYYIPNKWAMLKGPLTLKCVYYMPTRQRVDLCNLLAATCDILVHYGVLEDDNSNVVVSHDGSRVAYDKANPRVEIELTDAG